jgi:Transglutaminase-like superfamily
MASMDPLAYYAVQSPFTDPGDYARLFDPLPHDIAGLCRVVQGLVIHFRGAEMFGHTIPQQRLAEVNTRHVSAMLARIHELDGRPLTEPRPPENRLVGCCRDFATLFCAMARSRGIPTRTRIGFARYFAPDFNHDHEIAECWDPGEQRWRLVDPEQSPLHVEANRLSFDPLDVPRDQFLVAGLVWQRCRAGEADPERFGVDPGAEERGWWFVRHELIQDLAAQNKRELLLWDSWGLMAREPSEEDLALLDEVASVTQGGPAAYPRVRALYEGAPGLRVPERVMSFSPVAQPAEVTLAI